MFETYLYRWFPRYHRGLSNRSQAPIMVLLAGTFAVDWAEEGVENPRILVCTTVSCPEDPSSSFCLNTILTPSLTRSVRLVRLDILCLTETAFVNHRSTYPMNAKRASISLSLATWQWRWIVIRPFVPRCLRRTSQIRVTLDRVSYIIRLIDSLRVIAAWRRSARGCLVVACETRGIRGEQLLLDTCVHGQAQRGEQQLVRHLWRKQRNKIK